MRKMGDSDRRSRRVLRSQKPAKTGENLTGVYITLRILIKSAAVLFQFGHYSDEFGHYSDEFGHVQKLAALG